MTRHIIDGPRARQGSDRLRRYLAMTRRGGARVARALWQRPVKRDDSRRLRACLSIARGRLH